MCNQYFKHGIQEYREVWLCLYAATLAPPPCHLKNLEEVNEGNDDDEAVREGPSLVQQGRCGCVDHMIPHM